MTSMTSINIPTNLYSSICKDAISIPIEFNDVEDTQQVNIPTSFDTIIEVPQHHLPDHKVCDLERMKAYFQSLTQNQLRICQVFVDGKTYGEEDGNFVCAFCETFPDEKWSIRCPECLFQMCQLCWSEKTEEIALQNGSTKWHERKDKVERCRQHILQSSSVDKCVVPIENFCNRQCNICSKALKSCEVWKSNQYHDLDICLACKNDKTQEVSELIQTHQHPDQLPVWFENTQPERDCHLLDFIPILESKEGHMLALNINQNSSIYRQVMLITVDDHGRQGFYHIPKTLNEIFDQLHEMIPNYINFKENTWDKHYSSPIAQLAQHEHFQVYLG